MKFLVIDEVSRDEWDKMIKNRPLHAEAREKGEIPELIFPDHVIHGDLPQLTQNGRGFKIYDVDDPQQLVNVEAIYAVADLKTWKRWVIPITENAAWSPAYEKYKKKAK